MNNVDISLDNALNNISEQDNYENKIIKDLTKTEDGKVDEVVFLKIKEYESINERNLMTLPFVWLRKNPPGSLTRTWKKSNGDTVSIKVSGGPLGIPSIFEFDILLALLKIYVKDNGGGFYINKSTNECDISDKIHFSYRELAKEMGYKNYGGSIKKRLEEGITRLTETTMYSEFSLIDAKDKEYISQYKGIRSSRLIERYVGYEKDKYLRMYGEELTAREIKEYQVIQLDKFFFENLKNRYFQVYNYNTYIKLRQGVSKRLFLIFSTWSRGSSKFVKYQTLYDYIGLDNNTPKDKQSNNRLIKKALDELVSIGFIDKFEIKRGREPGINIIFNSIKNDSKLLKGKYTNDNECVERLRVIGFDYSEILDIMNDNDRKYIAGLLRYIDAKENRGEKISSYKEYFLKGIRSKFNIDDYI